MSEFTLFGISFVLNVIVSVAIAAFTFWLWRRYRYPFLLLFAFGALLDIFTALVQLASYDASLSKWDYILLLKTLYTLSIISALIFGTGLGFLIRHIRSIAAGEKGTAANAAQSV
jgi:uncharacterized membrane protein